MRSINLFSFTRIPTEYASEYLSMLADREQKSKVKPHEFETIRQLTSSLEENAVSLSCLDGFFFSYSIHQIGKEFDLLKIEPGKKVLNIELKCEPISEHDMEKQLRQNRYYLEFIAPELRLFTFVGSTGELYQLEGEVFHKSTLHQLTGAMHGFDEYITEDIDRLFEPKQFLISPFTDPEKFLGKKYFLTQQQMDIREKILEQLGSKGHIFRLFGISGGIGSGKTLLLYDIARSIAKKDHLCCIIDSDSLSPAHKFLNSNWDKVSIKSVREVCFRHPGQNPEQNLDRNAEQADTLTGTMLNEYEYIFIDEIHRMDMETVRKLLTLGTKSGATLICTYVSQEWLSRAEKQQNILKILNSCTNFTEWMLSKRIRTGVDHTAFYRNMLELSAVPRGDMDYSGVEILYAADRKEADRMIAFYKNELHYSCPSQNRSDEFPSSELEYNSVLIPVEESFGYDEEGVMCDLANPMEEMELDTQLYRYVSRTRNRLCILVIGNYELFLQIADIKYRMLERVRYQTSILETSLSGKQLTKLTRAIKSSAEELGTEDAQIVIDSVDLITEELQARNGNRKVIRNNLHFLKKIMEENREKEAFSQDCEAYISYLGAGEK